MKKYIVANDAAENASLVIQVETDLPDGELADQIKTACFAFVNSGTPEAGNALSATSGHFNWGDMALWLPADFQDQYGFRVLDAAPACLVAGHDEPLAGPDAM